MGFSLGFYESTDFDNTPLSTFMNPQFIKTGKLNSDGLFHLETKLNSPPKCEMFVFLFLAFF